MEVEDGKDYAESNPSIHQVWEALDVRLEQQTTTMDQGCHAMVTMFIAAFNAVQLQQGTTPTESMRQSYEPINVIYSDLMSNALESGGSPMDVGEDIEREEKVFDRVLSLVGGGGGDGGGVRDLKFQLAETSKSYSVLEAKHRLLSHNFTSLTQRAREAGV